MYNLNMYYMHIQQKSVHVNEYINPVHIEFKIDTDTHSELNAVPPF